MVTFDKLLLFMLFDVICLAIIFIFDVFTSIDLSFVVALLLFFCFGLACVLSLGIIFGDKNDN